MSSPPEARPETGHKGGAPALWIVLFFLVLAALQASFYVLASRLPDDSLPSPAAGLEP